MFSVLFVNIVILLGFNNLEPLSLATCNQHSFADPLITSLHVNATPLRTGSHAGRRRIARAGVSFTSDSDL